MIEARIFCDRCGEDCSKSGTAYYTIDIFGHDINRSNDGRVGADTALQNIETNMKNIANNQRHYCKTCKNEIEKFLKEKV